MKMINNEGRNHIGNKNGFRFRRYITDTCTRAEAVTAALLMHALSQTTQARRIL